MLYLRLKSYTSRFLSQGINEKLDSVFVPLAIMAVGAAINFFMFVLIARTLSAEQFALFAFWFSIISLLAGIGVAGQGALIFKNWNKYIQSKRFDLARGSFLFGTIVSCMGAGLAGLAAALLHTLYDGSIQLALSCAVFAIFFTVIYFISPATRAISGFVSGDGHMEITWRVFSVAAVLLLTAKGLSLSVADIFWIMSAGVALALGLSFYSILSATPKEILHSKANIDLPDWRKKSIQNTLANIVSSVSNHIDVLVIGVFVDPLLAGGYFVAMRIANVFKRLTAAFANYASRRVAPLYFAGEHQQLRSSLKDLSLVALLLVAGGLLLLVITANWLLALFGATYSSELWTLLVLSLGAGITTLAGPSPQLLVHTGHESRFLLLLSIGLGLRCVFLIVLTPIYGTLGAAIASTAAATVTAILLTVACKLVVGMDPSILSLLYRRQVDQTGGQSQDV